MAQATTTYTTASRRIAWAALLVLLLGATVAQTSVFAPKATDVGWYEKQTDIVLRESPIANCDVVGNCLVP